MQRLHAVLMLCSTLAATVPVAAEPRVGADLSSLPRLESHGATFSDGGTTASALSILRDAGYDLLRLRVWHSPVEPWHGLDSTLAFARRAHADGWDLLLDLHYSDTWADPGHQTKPAAWEGLTDEALADSLRAYTAAVVRRFEDAGVPPRYVQIGNEIDHGFVWDSGRAGIGDAWDTKERWTRFTRLLGAAVTGARDGSTASHRPLVLLHLAEGGDGRRCRRFLDRVRGAGIEFDAIGVSYYPWWHGRLSALSANLNRLASRYGRPVMVVETAYPWTLGWKDGVRNLVGLDAQLHPGFDATPEGQRAFLARVYAIVRAVPGGLGAAVLPWEPASVPCTGCDGPLENLSIFDFEGRALPGLRFARPKAAERRP